MIFWYCYFISRLSWFWIAYEILFLNLFEDWLKLCCWILLWESLGCVYIIAWYFQFILIIAHFFESSLKAPLNDDREPQKSYPNNPNFSQLITYLKVILFSPNLDLLLVIWKFNWNTKHRKFFWVNWVTQFSKKNLSINYISLHRTCLLSIVLWCQVWLDMIRKEYKKILEHPLKKTDFRIIKY